MDQSKHMICVSASGSGSGCGCGCGSYNPGSSNIWKTSARGRVHNFVCRRVDSGASFFHLDPPYPFTNYVGLGTITLQRF